MANPRLDVSVTGQVVHDDAIHKVIEILRANQQVSALGPPDAAAIRRGRRQITCAAADYRAAVTGLVIEGSLNIDDGRQLLGIVEAILLEAVG
jgi:hypothetical protein